MYNLKTYKARQINAASEMTADSTEQGQFKGASLSPVI